MKAITLILYTTLYRKGGAEFKRVAETMAKEKSDKNHKVICRAIETKEAIKQIFRTLVSEDKQIQELHFIGHSGMYGPMFGTIAYPEQFSPFEIQNLHIPFAENASAFFHCCRSARWFAPYFAREQQVRTAGYHWYTTFSSAKDVFRPPLNKSDKLYCFGCPGKKSHGLMASAKKYLGLMKAEEMKVFEPSSEKIDKSYDAVAKLYAHTFRDIKVRKDEFAWLQKHIPAESNLNVLDIGCGNGALLRELSDRIQTGVGVDVSKNLLQEARESSRAFKQLSFELIDGPSLPFPNQSFDLTISMLSFRYLDWDPLMLEIERIMKPDGKVLILDMVTAPLTFREIPVFIRDKIAMYLNKYTNTEFQKNLSKLVNHPDWAQMLKYNPIRSQHEMKWYLESRFPGRKIEIINVGMHSRIIAFDSKNMKDIQNTKLSYP